VFCGVLLAGPRVRRWPCALAGVSLLSVAVGFPHAGANAGGFLGAAAGTAAAGLVWWRGRVRARDAAAALSVVSLALAGIVAWDLAQGAGMQTHVARAAAEGAGLGAIAVRKAALNWWLLLHSPWSLDLSACVLALAWMWRAAGLGRLVRAEPAYRGAAAGVAVGAAALLLLNDSGVVSAANALLPACAAAALVSGCLDKCSPQAHT
jgi:hypothetical protein